MKLVIVSHTEHYRRDGQIVGWGTTVREIDYLSRLFDQVVHVAPLHSGVAPASAIPYQSERVELRAVSRSGGRTPMSKVGILWQWPEYARVILRELRGADVVHVRCPANISLLAIMLLAVVRQPRIRWIKYAGNWAPTGGEAWSYKFQRWWLRHNLSRSVVTVNGEWPEQPRHVFSFLNPCLTDREVETGSEVALDKELRQPIRLIFVGRVDEAKGIGHSLDIVRELSERGVSLLLDVVGDGPERPHFERVADELGIKHLVRFHGALSRLVLPELYSRAHLILLPSSSEGWPKVLSEAMAYGVVPIASNISSIPYYLDKFGTGKTIAPNDISGYVKAVQWYVAHPRKWKEEAYCGVQAAAKFSYREYLEAVQALLGITPNVDTRGSYIE